MMKTKHPAYFSWANMKARCSNPNATGYARYGGRGITVCERWKESFEAFLEDMGDRPEGGTVERIDNSKGYEPSNCRWATKREQSRNVDRNLICVIGGKEYKAAELADLSQYSARAIYERARSDMSLEEVLYGPRRPATNLEAFQKAGWEKRRNQTHCKRGHEFTPENTYYDKRGSRVCRACVNAKGRAWRAKRDGKA